MASNLTKGKEELYGERDIQFEKALSRRKYQMIWNFLGWSMIMFCVWLFVSFLLAGYYDTRKEGGFIQDIYLIQGFGELFWFSTVGGFLTGGLPNVLAWKSYRHPDTIIKEELDDKDPATSRLLSEGERRVRGAYISDGPSAKVVNEALKSGQKAASVIKKHIHEHLPEREGGILFEDVVPATMLAGGPFPYSIENRSLFCIGSAGSGKSQIMKELIYGIRKRGGRDKIIFYDRKPEYLPMFYRPGDKILCPADLRHTNWDIFAEVEGEQDIDGIIKSLIPNPAKEGSSNDRFWVDSARNVFRAILVWLMMEHKKAHEQDPNTYPSPKPSNNELVKLMAKTVSDPQVLWHVLKNNLTTAYLASCLSVSDRPMSGTAASIIGSLTAYTLSFTRAEVAERGDFSVKQWLHSDNTEGTAIFLSNPAKYGDNYESYFTMVVNLALTEMISLPNDNNRRVWFILDEFGSLMKLGAVTRLLAEGRSKGACTVIGTQDISQIKQKYADEHKTIINNCNSQCVARITDYEEAKYFAETTGEMEIEKEKSDNASMELGKEVSFRISDQNNQTSREKRQVVLPAEITNMPDLNYIVKPSEYGWFKNAIKYYPWGNHDIIPPFIQRPAHYFATERVLMDIPGYMEKAINDAKEEIEKMNRR